MRNWLLVGGMGVLAACSSSKEGTSITCGDGTMQDGDQCVPTGSGANTTCGAGTHLSGTMCVPDSPGATGSPTISQMTPDHAGVAGLQLFTIDGTGFAGADVTTLHVFFGDTTLDPNGGLGPCEAQIGAATATEITGEVPVFCNLNVMVTVQTNIGSATTPFHYDALFAADGDGGGSFGQPGDLYIIDPYNMLWGDLGALADTGQGTYGVSGIAFASDGTLYGVTTGTTPTELLTGSQLVKIDPSNGTVSVVGPLNDAQSNNWYVTDVKYNGTTLVGWGILFGSTTKARLVSINTANGKITPVGAPASETYTWNGGLAIDGNGTLVLAAHGAGHDTDSMFPASGAVHSVNGTTGALTSMATLDYPIGAPVNAMTYVGTTLVAAVDNGTYGGFNSSGMTIYGVNLAVIDMSGTQIVNPVVELPAALASQSHIDALDVPPAAFVLANKLTADWKKLAPATPVTR